jgi:hypothetical protein
MTNIIDVPKSFAVCFIGGDKKRTDEQEDLIKPLTEKYQIEHWRRSDRFSGFYSSFSQIVNEAVAQTKEEFIFFINPKVNPNPIQIEEMLLDLCSGFCWTSKISFGLWGTTKELFRNIGLLDERFIGSEWEDNDFLCRMKIFDKAIKWQYSTNLYPSNRSPINELRGMSLTLFRNKWIEMGDILYLDKSMSENKILFDNRSRDDIKKSWMCGLKSLFLDKNGPAPFYFKDIRIKEFFNKFIYCDSIINILFDLENIKIEFICEVETEISVQILNCNKELITYGVLLNSNTWNSNVMFENITDFNEIKIFHEGDKIYHNKNVKIPGIFQLNIGLKINKKI